MFLTDRPAFGSPVFTANGGIKWNKMFYNIDWLGS